MKGVDFNQMNNSILVKKNNKIHTNLCPDHPSNRLTLYVEDIDKYICTKCLIKNREQHFSHTILEIKDMYDTAQLDLDKSEE